MATVWVLVSSTLFELFERGVRKEGKGGPDLKLVVDSTAGSLKAFEGTMFVCGKQPHPSHTMETILFRQRKCQITERERTCAAQGDEKISSGTVFRASKLPNRSSGMTLRFSSPQCWHNAPH